MATKRTREELLTERASLEKELAEVDETPGNEKSTKSAEAVIQKATNKMGNDGELIASLSEDTAHELIELLRENRDSLKGTKLVPETPEEKQKSWFDRIFE
jgi:hypothetical protein